MRILFLTVHSGVKGKANLDTFNVAAELAGRNHDVYLVTRGDLSGGGQSRVRRPDGITVLPIAFRNPIQSLMLFPWFYRRVSRAVKSLRPDIIISENNLHCPFVGAALAARGNYPLLILLRELTADAIFYDRSRSWMKRLVAFIIMKASHGLLRRANYKLAINNGIASYYEQALDEEVPSLWLLVFPQMDARPDSEALARRFPEIASNKLKVVYSGSLTRERGIEVVLRTIAELPERDRLHLFITGSGKGKGELVELTGKLGLDDHVTFVDWLADGEFNGFLQSMDVGIEPYHRPWPQDHTPSTKLATYRAAGLFVLATRAPGYTELLSQPEAGMTYDTGPELGALLEQCMERKRKGGAWAPSKASGSDVFTLEDAVDRFEGLLRKVVQNART